MNTFKPTLAATIKDVAALKFPVLASQKLDGIRATVQGGQLLSRSLKPIPNAVVQEMFAGLPEGIDGELILGDPCAPDAYRKTVSIVMSDDKPAYGVKYHVFDKRGPEGFAVRLAAAALAIRTNTHCELVQHVTINNAGQLEELEAGWLALGHEGVMCRSVDGRYKEGRSTLNDGILGKLKRFEDSEAVVMGSYEELENCNEEFTNELGRTARSSHQENKIGKGRLGGLELRGMSGDFEGVEFCCGTGFDACTRQDLWLRRKELIGLVAKYKYFPSGSKDRPRHPVWLGWRDARDTDRTVVSVKSETVSDVSEMPSGRFDM